MTKQPCRAVVTAGRCQAFTVTAEVKPAERSDEYEVGNGPFESRTAAFCEPVAPAAARVIARGARGTAPADRALTLHLRDDLRVDQVIGALAAAAGLVPVVDGDRVLLGRGTADEVRGRKDAVNVCEIPVPYGRPDSRWASLSPALEKLAAGDLELAGLVRQGDTWTAWAFTPTRKLKVLKAGEKLSGASVSAVGPGGVTLATEGSGSVNLALRP